MSTQPKGVPTPKRPRKPAPRKRLDYKARAHKFIITVGLIVCAMALIIGSLVGLQGTVAGAPDPSPARPTDTARPSPSPSNSNAIDPQTALRFQAAALAVYLGLGISEEDPSVTLKTKKVPPVLKSGEKAPELAAPVSFRITRAGTNQLVVCTRAALPGSGLIDEYYIFPPEYEAEKGTRCPTESPTEIPTQPDK